jgi:ECF sigma factor
MVMHQIGINLPGWRGHRLPSSPPQCLVDTSSQPVSELLVRWKAEDREALEKLVPLVYKELREIARCHLQRERPPGMLCRYAALVHEVYLRLVDQEPSEAGRIEWDDDHDGRLPMLIIDGREVTWEDFGRMLMSFEGFHFELNIRDKSEEF